MESVYSSVTGAIYSDLHKMAVIIAACLVLVALALSLFLIFRHLKCYTNPAEQKWVVAVLFMVPVYATESVSSVYEVSFMSFSPRGDGVKFICTLVLLLNSFQIVSLWNPKLSLACDILRNCYEAFALYSFGRYLIACLGGERQAIELLEDESRKLLQKPLLDHTNASPKKKGSRVWNFIFQPCVLGEDLLTIEKFSLVQYMILKTVCAFLALILELLDVYCDGEFKWNCGYPYMAVVLNFSQMWALFCLVQFYNTTHQRLKSIKPLAKFISFKAIVFATWWQGVGIALLCSIHVLPKEGKLQTGLQDFLICIEMAIAAVAHVFVFPVEPYRYVPIDESPKVTTGKAVTEVKIEEGDKEDQAVVDKTDRKVEAPGTSVTESVQDIIVKGGHHVVKDVVLTINQAIEPIEKGVAKIQETIHQRSEESDEQVEEVEAEERVELEGKGSESETAVSIEERVVK